VIQYGKKIVTNVTSFDVRNFYYFRNELDQLFGITKEISQNEYELLKMIYVEKTFYSNDASNQAMYEYIYENKKFPFKSNDYKFIILTDKSTKQISQPVIDEILNILKDILGEIVVLDILGSKVIFFFQQYDTDLEHLFMTISSDFYLDLIVHDGIILNIDEQYFQTYFEIYHKLMKKRLKSFTSVTDLVMMAYTEEDMAILKTLKRLIIRGSLSEDLVQQMVQVLFTSNLNVSQASKELYMHRNTLISKLDQIKKNLGIDLQNFKQASIVYLLLHLKD
jgi:hypothetical protein